jgi:hypothetical protein
MLLPRLLKIRVPDVPIGFFLHIPFPSYEIFRLLPSAWRKETLDGLLGAGNGNAGLDGINFLSGKDLNIENCVVFGFAHNGIEAALNQATQATMHILNTVTKNNSQDGIKAANAQAPAVQTVVDGSAAILDNIGIEAGQHSRVIVSRPK